MPGNAMQCIVCNIMQCTTMPGRVLSQLSKDLEKDYYDNAASA